MAGTAARPGSAAAPSRPLSYYEATARGCEPFPALQGDKSADACVIGGGYTGLSTVLHLAERGYRVVLLEAERIGSGASGRNGGQVIPGLSPGMTGTVDRLGEAHARQLWEMSLEAIDLQKALIARHGIACDWQQSGFLLAAAKPRHMHALAEEASLLNERWGYEKAVLLDRRQTQQQVASRRFHGGLLDRGGGHLHPLNYALGLARAATAAGAEIHEGTAVLHVERRRRFSVHTARGRIEAAHVVICANAHLGMLQPALAPRIMPVGTYIMATEPLGEARARRLLPHNAAVADSNYVLDYFRLSADSRLLFGGRVDYRTAEPAGIGAVLRRRMLATFPELDDVQVAYAWGGWVAITVNRLPHFGRLPDGTYFAQGFSGQGVALTVLAGKLIAEAIAGTAERFDLFARIPHAAFPGGRWLRVPLLLLARQWYRLRDLL